MSRNSSPKKNSITSSDEYDRLSDLYREAYDRVQSGGTGAGWSGIHYELMNILRQYGRVPTGEKKPSEYSSSCSMNTKKLILEQKTNPTKII